MLLYLATAGLLALALSTLLKTRELYKRGQPLSLGVSACWLAVDVLDTAIVLVSSVYSAWHLPFDGILRVTGVVMSVAGFALMIAGMIEFGSARRILGLEVSRLITTGVYRWTRNPQFLGWYLLAVGIALAGLSGYALLVALVTVVLGHYYIVVMEEPFLERVFGEEYLVYKRRVPRYLRLSKSRSV